MRAAACRPPRRSSRRRGVRLRDRMHVDAHAKCNRYQRRRLFRVFQCRERERWRYDEGVQRAGRG
eukprot:3981755-Pleurochrysis_carterae.AAC.1